MLNAEQNHKSDKTAKSANKCLTTTKNFSNKILTCKYSEWKCGNGYVSIDRVSSHFNGIFTYEMVRAHFLFPHYNVIVAPIRKIC